MLPTDLKSWLLYVILTILLGALGSGFWETAFKPVFSSIGRLLLRILTLGMTSALNSIYRDIARRFVHKPVLFIIMLLTFTFSVLLGASAHDYYLKSFGGARAVEEKIAKTLKEKSAGGIDSEITKIEADLSFCIFLMVTLGFVITSYSFLRNTYIMSAIIYFDQCLAICLPYLDEDIKRKLLSQYAQIKTDIEFSQIIKQLNEVAEKNSINMPKFILL